MLLSGRDLTDGQRLVADVAVVGAGPAGLTLAEALGRAGFDVLVLEAGSAEPPPRGEDVTGTRNVGLPYPLLESRARGVGGSSLRWDVETPVGGPYVRLRELDDVDFQVRPGIDRSGWPWGKEELAGHYRRAWEIFGLRPQDPAADSEVEGAVARRRFAFGPAATFTQRLPSALAAEPRVRLVSDVEVVDVRSDAQPDRVSALTCRSRGGARFTATARVYVLAGGGIENARLLLASRSRHPSGLANSSDLVGRCFMEHPHYASAVLVPERGAPVLDPAAWAVVAERGQAQQVKYGVAFDVLVEEGLLNAAFYASPRPLSRPVALRRDGTLDEGVMEAVHVLRAAALRRSRPPGGLRHGARALAGAPGLGRYALHQALAGRSGSARRPMFTLAVMAEQQPLLSSRVRLSAAADDQGRPMAELDWRTGAVDARSLHRTQELVGPVLGRALNGRVQSLVDAVEMPHLGGGYHHMGTTRMSASPQDGVVDGDGRAHDVGNLFLVGSSVFPTGGCANPTLTVVATALRTADVLRHEVNAHPGVRG